ncbi:uncharacterized protein LOC134259003 [Saccostrea cucullata]|uniref:uncharacterized protein LOC134259003 n=1 Tax=Saccostrea cuccullata TaxID=36930 RepID=UPI002ECFF040
MKTSKIIRSSAILGTFLSSTGRALHLDMYKFGRDIGQVSQEMGATLGRELLSLGESVYSFTTTTSAAALSYFSATDLLFFLAFLLFVVSFVRCAQFVRQFYTSMQGLKRKMADLAEENIQMRLILTAYMNDAEEAEKLLALKLSALSREQYSLGKWLNFHTDMFSIRLNNMESQAHKAPQSRKYRR